MFAARGTGSGPDILTPIMVNDNVVDLTVSPGAAEGQSATVAMRPKTSWVRMDVQVTTAAAGTVPAIDVIGTGSYLPHRWPETYATADIVAYDGTPRVKVGREFLLRRLDADKE